MRTQELALTILEMLRDETGDLIGLQEYLPAEANLTNAYSPPLAVFTYSSVAGQICPTSPIQWNKCIGIKRVPLQHSATFRVV